MTLPRHVIATVNLKGGTGKTTSSVYLAHVLHERGRRVLLVDADPQGSALEWAEIAGAGWPFPVVGLATKSLHQQLAGIADDTRYDTVVIDTPPVEEQKGIAASALRVASHVLVPFAPTKVEYSRVGDVVDFVNDTADLRPDGQAPKLATLLTRTIPRASSTAVYRELLTEEGITVLQTEVKRLESFAQAYGELVHDASQSAYAEAVTELLGGE